MQKLTKSLRNLRNKMKFRAEMESLIIEDKKKFSINEKNIFEKFKQKRLKESFSEDFEKKRKKNNFEDSKISFLSELSKKNNIEKLEKSRNKVKKIKYLPQRTPKKQLITPKMGHVFSFKKDFTNLNNLQNEV